MSIPFFIIISGPTGVGKTALIEELIPQLSFPIEIINADMGQLYGPLTIGTAKPDLAASSVPHHMFDIVQDPVDFTVSRYRAQVLTCMEDISARGAVPVVVGGSGFYIASLFYPPNEEKEAFPDTEKLGFEDYATEYGWEMLHKIDPARAKMIHKHDRYRIMRALRIFHETGKQPSLREPHFDPPGRCVIFFLIRDQQELHRRIQERVLQMMRSGWIDEVQGLNEEWHEFLLEKKLIGFRELVTYIHQQSLGMVSDDAYEQLIETISQKTRGYAKRQITFWKQLKKRLMSNDDQKHYILDVYDIDLSNIALSNLVTDITALYISTSGK